METLPTRTSFSFTTQAIGLVGWLVVTFIAAGIGAAASIRAADFYTQLARPEWAPPSSAFSPVWTALYILMAISAWLVWRTAGFSSARRALTLFIIQLALNALWSWPFFVWKTGGLALTNIVILWMFVVMTIAAFWRIHRVAGLLLVPYLLWVSFAGALNYAIWQMNPHLL